MYMMTIYRVHDGPNPFSLMVLSIPLYVVRPFQALLIVDDHQELSNLSPSRPPPGGSPCLVLPLFVYECR